MTVSANGISSTGFEVNVQGGKLGMIITPATLPNATDAAAYNQTIKASNGTMPYNFAIVGGTPAGGLYTGGDLPSGLSLNASTGQISGTPTEGGTFTFQVTVTDSSIPVNQSETVTYTLVVDAPKFTFNPKTLPVPAGTDNVFYTQTIKATGGINPDTLALVGVLPSGLTFVPGTGVLSGTPTEYGTFTVEISVTDSSGSAFGGHGPYVGTESYTLVINPPNIVVNSPDGSTLPEGTVAVNYSPTTIITATGGVPPNDFEVAGGTLPSGMTLDPVTGLLSGTPTERGTFPFQVSITDSSGSSDGGEGPYTVATYQDYTLVINPPVLTLTPTTLPAGTIPVAYNQTITASGGIAPYTFSISSGALPTGLTLSASGTISGVPMAYQASGFNFTVQVVDSSGGTGPYNPGTQSYTLTINPPTITVSPLTLPAGQVGVGYGETITAGGGTSPYTYSVAGGTPAGGNWTGGGLPTGLALNAATGVLSGTPSEGENPQTIIQAAENGNTVTITTTAPLGVGFGQEVVVSGVGTSEYDGAFQVTAVNGDTFSYTDTASGLGTDTSGGVAAIPFSFTVTAQDSSGGGGPFDGSQAYNLVINPPNIVVSPGDLPNAQDGVPFNVTLSGSGGTPNYTLSLVSGVLPDNVNFNYDPTTGTATISGTPTEAGVFNFTVEAQDSSAGTGPYTRDWSYTLLVNAPTITLNVQGLPPDSGLPLGQVASSYSQTLVASGGTAPYANFVLASGSGPLPAGLTLTTGGTITGIPTQAGIFGFTVAVTDSSTNDNGGDGAFTEGQSFVLTIKPPTIAITPTTLNDPMVGVSYSATLTASGGIGPSYGDFSITTGSLPPGMTLSPSGTIGGTPTAGGTFFFNVQAYDLSAGPFAGTASFTLTVDKPTITVFPGTPQTITQAAENNPNPNTVTITTAAALGVAVGQDVDIFGVATSGYDGSFLVTAVSGNTFSYTDSATSLGTDTGGGDAAALLQATVGASYSETLSGTGGTAPYKNFAVTNGALPPGLSLSVGGVLSGIPTGGGTFGFTVRTQDSSTGTGPYQGTTNYTITVAPPTITLSPSSLPSPKVGVLYSEQLSASGGTSPDGNFTATGTLPPGLTLTAGGLLSGTPTATGTFNFTVQALDSSANGGPYSGTQSYALTVAAPTITLGPASLPSASVAASYSETLTASGGTSPYSNFHVTGGMLPPGVSLTGGTLVGTPTGSGSFTFTVQAQDSSTGNGPYLGTGSYTLVVSPPTITLSPARSPPPLWASPITRRSAPVAALLPIPSRSWPTRATPVCRPA